MFESLKSETSNYWLDLIDKYLLGSPSVTIIARPSESLMREIGEQDNARFESRRKQLGKKGLADLKKIIDSAINQNDVNKNWGKYFEGISFFKRKIFF